MFAFLKNHPFAVEAFFKSSTVFTFAVPREQTDRFLPECLEADTYNDRWAFIAVAMVRTQSLRPKGFPAWLGNDFFLIGYRIFVRYHTRAGKRLRGLYILRSETDRRRMEFLGNLFTHYRYETVDITESQSDGISTIHSSKTGLRATFRTEGDPSIQLPSGSPFPSWNDARRFAGPLPFTFSYIPSTNRVVIIEGVRENWTPLPVQVQEYHFPFIESLGLKNATLANAFTIRNIPYYWKKGRTEIWSRSAATNQPA